MARYISLILALLAIPHLHPQPASDSRIVILQGFGDYFTTGPDGQPKRISPDGLGVNIVAVSAGTEGDRIWIHANGAGDQPVGWVDKTDAIPLSTAIPYFTARIERNPNDWDAYLRRAESEHALNRREAAIADYTQAIALHPDESFLYLRRGREYRILAACPQAAADFVKAASLRPQWAEPYNMAAGVYVDCPDPATRDPKKAIALIQRAFELSPNPTYLTVLALAYFRSGDIEQAAATQKQAFDSPNFPPAYRDEAQKQLQVYHDALAHIRRSNSMSPASSSR